MKVKKLLQISKEKLKNRGVKSPSLDLNILISKVLNINTKSLILHSEKTLSKIQIQEFNKLLERRLSGEPISHIIGKRGFWDFEFTVNKNTLDPRPDSETLIEEVLRIYKNQSDKKLNILELGVGTGCLIITLLKLFSNSTGLGIDISPETLKIANKNAEDLKIKNRIKFIKNNWNDNITEKFDIIISNPPYIPTEQIETLQIEVRDFEPHLALDGGDDGLDCYKYIAKNIGKNLNKNGKIFLEIGQNQENDIIKIFQYNNFKLQSIQKDLGGIVRVLCFEFI